MVELVDINLQIKMGKFNDYTSNPEPNLPHAILKTLSMLMQMSCQPHYNAHKMYNTSFSSDAHQQNTMH